MRFTFAECLRVGVIPKIITDPWTTMSAIITTVWEPGLIVAAPDAAVLWKSCCIFSTWIIFESAQFKETCSWNFIGLLNHYTVLLRSSGHIFSREHFGFYSHKQNPSTPTVANIRKCMERRRIDISSWQLLLSDVVTTADFPPANRKFLERKTTRRILYFSGIPLIFLHQSAPILRSINNPYGIFVCVRF